MFLQLPAKTDALLGHPHFWPFVTSQRVDLSVLAHTFSKVQQVTEVMDGLSSFPEIIVRIETHTVG